MVTLWLLGHSFRKIGQTFDPPVAPGTIKGIVTEWEENGKVRNKPQTGRKCLLNDEALKELEQLITKDGDTRRPPKVFLQHYNARSLIFGHSLFITSVQNIYSF